MRAIERERKDQRTDLLLEMTNVSKRFGQIEALKDVDFDVEYNQVMGLVGDNGAGKSTLIKILMGIHQPDKGEIRFEGKKVRFSSATDARAAGIEAVYQELGLVPTLDIASNFFLGKEMTKFGPLGMLEGRKMNRICLEYLADLGIRVRSPNELVAFLSGGERQAIAITRTMYFGAKLVVLDEPTAALSVKEAEKVLEFILDVKKRGLSVIFITHNIYHLYSVADRFTILERGEKVGAIDKKDVTEAQIMRTISTGKPQWTD